MKVLVFIIFFAFAYATVDKCPPNHTEEPVFVSDPTDCTSYYQCVDGTAVLEHCPPGLEWAAALNRCDWPTTAQCVETETKPPTEPTTRGTTSSPKPKPDKCPAEDGDEDVLLKNPADCSSFFKCYKGKPILVKCPVGQEWADHLNRCDWPEVAHCVVTVTTKSGK